ncbi:MAG: helix-turn-helix domain-containing protein [Pirellulales bacterium]|nr:helix-turn-helix domain-containing protein [Pirellulales bacterium]
MDTNRSTPPLLVSAREASRMLGICEKSLWTLTAPRGPIPAVKLGKRILYCPLDLIQFIEAKKVRGGQPT